MPFLQELHILVFVVDKDVFLFLTICLLKIVWKS